MPKFDGVGRVRIFDENVRRGIAAVEEYVYNAIVKGANMSVINSISRIDGKEVLVPTVVSKTQTRKIAEQAYDAVQSGYGFFSDVPGGDSFKEWVVREIDRRISCQVTLIDSVEDLDIEYAEKVIEAREFNFRAYLNRDDPNPAKQRRKDILLAREIAKMCWDRKTSIKKICTEFAISEWKLECIRKSVYYLREVSGLILTTRSDKRILSWLQGYEGQAAKFAARMGINEDVAAELFADIKNRILEAKARGETL